MSFVFIAGCAGTKSVSTPNKDEYVEIDNPAYTMSPDAPPTIWVPRSYVESGVPRGGELVKKGYEAAKTGLLGSPAPQNQQVAVAPEPASIKAAPVVKNRIAVLEVGKNGLAPELGKDFTNTGSVILVEPSQIAMLGRYASVVTEPEKRAFAVRLQEDYGANLLVMVSAPDGISPGKTLKAELYYCLGGDLVKTFAARLPQYSESDRTSAESAVAGAVGKLSRQINEEVSLLPWYGKVVATEDGRIYINAGKEAGIRLGQMLKVYRGGKVVKGLGFAPGKNVGVVTLEGYVGANGSFGKVTEGGGIQVSDLVSVE